MVYRTQARWIPMDAVCPQSQLPIIRVTPKLFLQKASLKSKPAKPIISRTSRVLRVLPTLNAPRS